MRRLLKTLITSLSMAVCSAVSASTEGMALKELQHASGTVFCDGAIRGSAVHVSHLSPEHSIIATAAHVLVHAQTRQPFKSCFYRPANARFSSVGFAQISTQATGMTLKDSLRNSELDWAFVALKRKLAIPALRLSLRGGPAHEPSRIQALTLVRYQGDHEAMRIDDNCAEVHSEYLENTKLLLHTCAAGPGVSGAPLIDPVTHGLVGIHGGTLSLTTQVTDKPSQFQHTKILQARAIDQELIDALARFSRSLP